MRCLVDKATRPSSLLRDAIKVATEGLLTARFSDTRLEPFTPGYFLTKLVLRQVREALKLLAVDRGGNGPEPFRRQSRVAAPETQEAEGSKGSSSLVMQRPLPDNIKAIVLALCRVPEHEARTSKQLARDVKVLTGIVIESDNVRQTIKRYRSETGIEQRKFAGYFIPIARRPAWALTNEAKPVT
jgi:hypothetical protein